jgi:hypothetical protein
VKIFLGFILAFGASIVNAAPIEPGQVEVLDGDTVRVAGETFRLVGFDAPETYRAQCPSERELGNRATFQTFKVWPKDLPGGLWQFEGAGDRPAGTRNASGVLVAPTRVEEAPCST